MNCVDNSHDHRGHGPNRVTTRGQRARSSLKSRFGARGGEFWRGVSAEFDLSRDEVELLVEVCRSLDLLDDLRSVLDRDGPMSIGSQGQPVAHPALAHINAAKMTLGRLLKQLGLPREVEEPRLTPAQVQASNAVRARHNERRRVRNLRGA